MEFSKEDDNTKTLLPELVNRYKKIRCLKNQRKQKSINVLKVFYSKKKQIKQLKKQIQSFEELCDGLKQKAKCTEIKVSSMASNIAFSLQRNDKLNQKCVEIDHHLAKIVEQFENDMKIVDQQFISASDSYSKENRQQMTAKICEEIAAEETAIDQILSGQQSENLGGYDLEKFSRNLNKSLDLSKQESMWKETICKNVELKNKIAELENTIKELEAAI